MDPSLHFSTHCEKAASKANRLVGLIRRSFSYLDGKMLTQLFKAIVRPHIEYANVVWSPQYAKDATLIENVQRRATRLVPELRGLEYEERLRALKLPSLLYRRWRGDLIEAYKYLHNVYRVKNSLLPLSDNTNTRGHSKKVKKSGFRLDCRRKFFSTRIINQWNALPKTVAEAPSLNSFKGRLDRFLSSQMYSISFPLPVVRGVAAVETQSESDIDNEEQ